MSAIAARRPDGGGGSTAHRRGARPAPRGVPLDAVNPVTRIVALVVLSVPLLVTIDVVSAGIAVVAFAALAPAAGFGPRRLLARIWPLLLFAPVAGVSMLLYARPEGTVYWSFGIVAISENSVELAIAVSVRVLALALPAMLLFARVDPTDLADGLVQLARLPERFVIGVLAGTRLLSLFADDWRAMTLARRARGLGDGLAVRRIPVMAFVLLVFAVRRGAKLATAMEARGFGAPGPRSHARRSRWGTADLVFLAVVMAIVAVALGGSLLLGTFRVVGA